MTINADAVSPWTSGCEVWNHVDAFGRGYRLGGPGVHCHNPVPRVDPQTTIGIFVGAHPWTESAIAPDANGGSVTNFAEALHRQAES